MSGPYPGPPIPSYSQHQHNAPPQYPPYSSPPPPADPRYGFSGHPSQPPQPPPPTYGPPAPYGHPPGPPGYGGHARQLPPPPPPQGLPLPPPPQSTAPPYPSPYGHYPPQHGLAPGQNPHDYRPQGPPAPAPPPVHYPPPSHRSQPPPRPPPRPNTSSKPAHSPGTKTQLPAPPLTHSLPPKPPPSAHDRPVNRPERHRDNRTKRKNDKHDRHKGPRDNRQKDSAHVKASPNKKQNQERREHQGHPKSATQEPKSAEKVPYPENGQPITEPQESAGDRDSEEDGRAANPDHQLNETIPSTAVIEPVDQEPEDDRPNGKLAQHHDEQPPERHGEDESPHEHQPKSHPDLAPAIDIHRRESVHSTESIDLVAASAVKGSVDESLTHPKLESVKRSPSYDDVAKDEAVVLNDGRDRRKRSFTKRPSQDSPLKRRRSNDDNHYEPESPQRRRVTESNLNSLQQSYRSPQARHNGMMSRSNRRRSGSRDRSRQGSPAPSISSRSSGLDSLEAELLGRPAKGRSDDAVDEKPTEKSPKAKRRRPNVDSAYR